MTQTELDKAEAKLAEFTKKTVKELRELAKEDPSLKGVASMKKQPFLFHLMTREGFLMEMVDDTAVIIDTDEFDESNEAESASVDEAADTKIDTEDTQAAEAEEPVEEAPETQEVGEATSEDKPKAKKSSPKPTTKKFVKLGTIHNVIAKLHSEEQDMTVCPLTKDGKPCKHEKDPGKLICEPDYKAPWGRRAIQIVRADIDEFVPRDVFWDGVNAAKSLINLDEDGSDEIKALPDYLKNRPAEPENPDFVDLSGIHINMLRKMAGVAMRKLEDAAMVKVKTEKDKVAAAAKKDRNDSKMTYTLEEIEKDCPAPEFPKPNIFYGRVAHPEHGKISNGMIDVACNFLWRGNDEMGLEPRWKEWGRTARDLCDLAVEAEWPRDKDPYGKKINVNFFTNEVIKARQLEHLGKLVTEKMMMNACRAGKRARMNDKFAKRAAKPSRDDVAVLENIEGVSYSGQTASLRR